MDDAARDNPEQPWWREPTLAFGRLLWQRFLDDKCFEAAGALSYTTVFAIVPLTTAVFGIIAAFPTFREWSDTLTDFVFANFVPSAGTVVQGYLRGFAENASQLTTAGVAALLITALMMMSSVEETFNRIWRAPPRRQRVGRFMMYWTTLSLGPLLIAASLGLSANLLSFPALGDAARTLRLTERLFALLPVAVTWTAVTLAYLIVPNAKVRFRHAAVGALFATALFEATKWLFTAYLARANFARANFTTIFGPLATVPVFLSWIYLSWSVVLLGASLAASLSAFRFRAGLVHVSSGLEFALLLRLLRRITLASRAGHAMKREQLRLAEPEASDSQLDRALGELAAARLVQRGESAGYLPMRDAATLDLAELFRRGRYRLPDAAELGRLEKVSEPEDAPLLAWLREASAAQASVLARPVAVVLPGAASLGAEAQAVGAATVDAKSSVAEISVTEPDKAATSVAETNEAATSAAKTISGGK
jgi:membrane protein